MDEDYDYQHEVPVNAPSGFGSIVILIVFIIVAVWLGKAIWNKASDFFGQDEYTGYFYYDPSNLTQYWRQPGLISLDACIDWVNAQIPKDFDGYYDYECGVNCEYDLSADIDICDTTEQ